jgi:SOS-response transcriptional repressor LexA
MKQRLAKTSHQMMPLGISSISAGPAAWIADEHILIDLNSLITKGREGFMALTVTGDSAEPHIQAGNIIFVDTQAEPRNGEMVAAVINGLTCIKKFHRTECCLRLVSENEKYAPREITAADNFHVLGVVKGHMAVY